jgi:hypothetical protein
VPQIMAVFDRVLGVECTHCHVAGAMEKADKRAFVKARRMFQMRNWIAQNAKVESACWTCHRGPCRPGSGTGIQRRSLAAELDLPADQASQPAAKVYENLKFFNGAAGDLKASMLFMCASLGRQLRALPRDRIVGERRSAGQGPCTHHARDGARCAPRVHRYPGGLPDLSSWGREAGNATPAQ